MRIHRLQPASDSSEGAPFRLVGEEIETPEPGPRQILIKVHAASISRRDLSILSGHYPLPARTGVVPLSDGAGEVVAMGDAVTRFHVGDRVTGSYWPFWHDGPLTPDKFGQLGCTEDGMLAEYVLLDADSAVLLPDYLTWEEAAGLTCAGVTAWSSVTRAGLLPGQTVLTLGSGDVSLFAVQFAKLLGCRVVITSSNPAKEQRLRDLGADHVIDYSTEKNWGEQVLSLTGGRGAELVVETHGPATIEQSLAATGGSGEIVLLWVRSPEPTPLVIGDGVYRGLTSIRREFVGSRADLEAMLRAMEYHRLRPPVDKVFEFDQAESAFEYFRGNAAFGKVVIRVG